MSVLNLYTREPVSLAPYNRTPVCQETANWSVSSLSDCMNHSLWQCPASDTCRNCSACAAGLAVCPWAVDCGPDLWAAGCVPDSCSLAVGRSFVASSVEVKATDLGCTPSGSCSVYYWRHCADWSLTVGRSRSQTCEGISVPMGWWVPGHWTSYWPARADPGTLQPPVRSGQLDQLPQVDVR